MRDQTGDRLCLATDLRSTQSVGPALQTGGDHPSEAVGGRIEGQWAEKDLAGGSQGMKAESHLEKILEKGLFAVTGELGPPKGNDVSVVKRKADLLRGYVDAVNITDNQTAIVRMSSIATSSFLIQMGLEPVVTLVTRDP